MSVIVSRALPDVRDGLKPVHRRILYAITGLGLTRINPIKIGILWEKCWVNTIPTRIKLFMMLWFVWLRIFSRYPMVDGQGNFGSMDGDAAAAMRYTEPDTHLAMEMLRDLDKETVDFRLNFDETWKSPLSCRHAFLIF